MAHNAFILAILFLVVLPLATVALSIVWGLLTFFVFAPIGTILTYFKENV